MNQIKKMLISLMVVLTLSMCLTLPAVAAETVNNSQTSAQSEIEPHADVIVKKYRFNSDGIRQYRRWNETKKRWVDPYWINM